jgi:hypothetical protein
MKPHIYTRDGSWFVQVRARKQAAHHVKLYPTQVQAFNAALLLWLSRTEEL